MDNFKIIQNKLEAFIKRYYVNELLKGAILFFAIGFLYLLLTLFIEYVLWLGPTARAILFWIFILIESGLFLRFVLWPMSKLLKLQRGISYDDASAIIGKHFPEVNDKLLNVLQLHRSAERSELLLASIDQKAAALQPIPFKYAVNFSRNIPYLKYAAIPIVILLITYFTGHFNWFSESYDRVVNYKTAYEPPAPFQFFVINEQLQALENKPYKLTIKTVGKTVPETAQIHYNGESYFLKQTAPGAFEYDFSNLKSGVEFKLSANAVTSKSYQLEVIKVPALLNFEMVLDYPAYTKRVDEVIKSNGNATVPEGTTITWKLKTRATDKVAMYTADTLDFKSVESGIFEVSKQIIRPFDYAIATSNKQLKDYETLGYTMDVIKDAYPELNIKVEKDTIDLQSLYFYGQASDDYGLTKLQLVYYKSEDETARKSIEIPLGASVFEEFLTAFPNNLELDVGVSYEFYFQLFDNDEVNHYKSVKSSLYTYRQRTMEEEESKQLLEQNQTIKNLDDSFEKMKLQEKQLNELSKIQKEKEQLSFSDKKKLENFIQRQKQQEDLMRQFNKQMQDNLENFQKNSKKEDAFKDDLKERLQDNEAQLQKDEKLLKELEKLQDKMQKEELTEKLDQLNRQSKNKKRSLEQLLELTKRYYVAKKTEKLQRELEALSEKQEELTEKNKAENTKEKQDALNKEFMEFQQELDALKKENGELKKPLDVPEDELLEKEIERDQQEASKELDEKEKMEQEGDENKASEKQKKAQKKQKDASRKMKQMSLKMSQSMMSGGEQQLQEDAAMLRQILDNLLLFSFEQEDLMEKFKSIQINHNLYGHFLRKQSSLKEHFGHIDDSLFALSLRQPKLSEHVNSKITDIYYYVDKSMEELSENLLFKGVSSQQFTVTATNELSSFLSDILDNMESDMNGQGQGEGKGKGNSGGGGMQLPDIIMSQEELNKQMEEGLKKSKSGKPDQGDNGNSGKEGSKGTKGEGENAGDSQGSDGDNDSEMMNGKLYEIYQQQQTLRQALQDKLGQMHNGAEGKKLLNEMEQIEMDLINKGFTNQTLQRMVNLQHQLLKLESATFIQGEESQRESNSNKQTFDNNTSNQIPTAKEYFNTTEILNRQALPLRQIYKKKVQDYFKKEHDKL